MILQIYHILILHKTPLLLKHTRPKVQSKFYAIFEVFSNTNSIKPYIKPVILQTYTKPLIRLNEEAHSRSGVREQLSSIS